MIIAVIQKILDGTVSSPGAFLGYTILIFCGFLIRLGLIAYIIGCILSEATRMKGILRVGVKLQVWPVIVKRITKDKDGIKEESVDEQGEETYLEYGRFWIELKDTTSLNGRYFNVKKWIQKAFPRQYALNTILEDFQSAFQEAGFKADVSSLLLTQFFGKDEDDKNNHEPLGNICIRKGKLVQTLYGKPIQTGEGSKLSICIVPDTLKMYSEKSSKSHDAKEKEEDYISNFVEATKWSEKKEKYGEENQKIEIQEDKKWKIKEVSITLEYFQ